MRKSILLILVIISIASFILVGCSSSSPATTSSNPTTTPATQPATATKPIELIYSCSDPQTTAYVTVHDAWLNKIEQATNGRVKFKRFYSGSLIQMDQTYAELVSGTADISEVELGFQPAGFQLIVDTRTFFYGIQKLEDSYRIYHQIINEFPEFNKELSGVKVLLRHDMGIMNINSMKPIRSLADFKGLKVRSIGAMYKDTLTGLGSELVSLSPSDFYISLQKGIADADIHAFVFMSDFKTAEIQHYSTYLGLCTTPGGSNLFMNPNTWNKLPPDIQKIIDDSLPQLEADFIAKMNQCEEDAITYAKSQGGHEFITLSSADLNKLYQSIHDECVVTAKNLDSQGLPGTKVLNRVQELINNK